MSLTLLVLVYSFERGVTSFIIQHHLPSEFSVRGCSFWICAIMYAASHGHLRLFHAENMLLHAGFYFFLGKVVKYHRAAEDIEVF